LDDVYPDYSFLQMRDELMKHYGYSLDYLRYKVKVGARVEAPQDARELNSLYRGITRFLLEDMTYQGQTQSRTQLQKRAKARAYEVIRRSNAWSELIAERFPHAVRLSIHPHFCGSSKLGIRLVADESWMTPWHGVLVETSAGPMLLKRAQAEKIGAQLCFDASGKPSHYRLLSLASPLREVM
jgi:pyoverdine/dityrosine biosynthesis protein Dit1